MKPFFSIVIPTLNEEKYLPRLLEDIKNQHEKNYEVIIVDASSIDNTLKKALEYKKIINLREYKVIQKNVSYSRNFGATKAKGKYLVFLDADVQIYPSFLKKLYRLINKNKGLLFIPNIIPNVKDPQMQLIFKTINFLVYFSQKTNKPFSNGGSMIIEKNFFNLIGGFDESLYLAEDHNLIQKAKLYGVTAKFLTNLNIIFSLRRLKREGQLKTLYKYIRATIHILLKGDIKEKIFDYSMGGLIEKKTNNNDFVKKILNYQRLLKKFVNKYF